MLGPEQAHGLAELAVTADVVEVQHEDDERALAAERERAHGGGQRIALARQGRGRGKSVAQATDRGHAVARREAEQRHVGEGHEAHAILVLHRVLREAAGGIHVVAEARQAVDRDAARAADVEHQHDLEVLVGETVARDPAADARARLPVDRAQRIARPVFAKLVQLRA